LDRADLAFGIIVQRPLRPRGGNQPRNVGDREVLHGMIPKQHDDAVAPLSEIDAFDRHNLSCAVFPVELRGEPDTRRVSSLSVLRRAQQGRYRIVEAKHDVVREVGLVASQRFVGSRHCAVILDITHDQHADHAQAAGRGAGG
jgi:hypothetical protein